MTRLHYFVTILVVASFLFAACSSESNGSNTTSSSSSSASGAGASLPEPAVHRASAETCTGTPPAGSQIPDVPESKCETDADCTAGDNGRCVWPYAGGNICIYDECFEDSDCGGSRVCGCRVSEAFGVNVCYHGNCKVDADCGEGGYCSPSGIVSPSCSMGISPGSVGYFCHTADDECTDDADCGEKYSYACLLSVEAGHWVCQELLCLG